MQLDDFLSQLTSTLTDVDLCGTDSLKALVGIGAVGAAVGGEPVVLPVDYDGLGMMPPLWVAMVNTSCQPQLAPEWRSGGSDWATLLDDAIGLILWKHVFKGHLRISIRKNSIKRSLQVLITHVLRIWKLV